MSKLSIVLAIGVILTVSFFSFIPDGESEVLERLNKAGVHPKSRIISHQDSLQIRAMHIGEPTKPVLLLIHGSPGDWSAWEHIITNDSIREAFQIVSIDRAGYGETTVPALEKLDDQAIVVWSMMKELAQTKDITVVGHSYGGAVAEQLLIDHPDAFRMGRFGLRLHWGQI
jgi:Predicted hydrolases or acyltransferases (alpha/beta hydrolase superfamily)